MPVVVVSGGEVAVVQDCRGNTPASAFQGPSVNSGAAAAGEGARIDGVPIHLGIRGRGVGRGAVTLSGPTCSLLAHPEQEGGAALAKPDWLRALRSPGAWASLSLSYQGHKGRDQGGHEAAAGRLPRQPRAGRRERGQEGQLHCPLGRCDSPKLAWSHRHHVARSWGEVVDVCIFYVGSMRRRPAQAAARPRNAAEAAAASSSVNAGPLPFFVAPTLALALAYARRRL